VELSDTGWGQVLTRLEKLRLVHVLHKGAAKPAIDAHPLIREHFASQLSGQHLDVWCAAHRRLYEHLTATTEEFPDTLEGLLPLYQAVAHGCKAGMHQEAYDDVHFRRIRRGNEYYSIHRLGALGADLGAVACFFEEPWKRVTAAMPEAKQAVILGQAAFCLRALGRLTETIEPMRATADFMQRLNDWKQAAMASNNLSELELTLGEVGGAVGDAERSVVYADRSDVVFHRISKRATLANSMHQAGRRDEAQARFREAEEMQKKNQAQYPLLYSVGGFQFCDLLLADAGRAAWELQLNPNPEARNPRLIEVCREVEQRAAQTIKIAERNAWLLDIALDHLTLGRAVLYASILDLSAIGNRRSIVENLRSAVEGLRRAGTSHHLPRGLLTRAWLRFLEDDPVGARTDLDEAWEISERGPMRLYMADIHLYRARLFKDKEELKKAREMIEDCGYWRRKEELEDAEAAVKGE